MAKRESQGLQIALILFVMVTVVLAVTTYLYWSKSEANLKEAAELRIKTQEAENSVRVALDENIRLKQMIGHAAEEKLDAVQTAYDEDMTRFAQTLPEEERNYRRLPHHLEIAIKDLNKQVVEANDRVKVLLAEKEQVRKEEQSLTSKAKETHEVAARDLQDVRTKVSADVSRVNEERTQLAQLLDQVRKESTSKEATQEGQIQTLAQEVQKLSVALHQKIEELNRIQKETFEVPDGEIAWVNQRSRSVWINLGEGDGLRRQMTFSVYGKGQNDMASAQKKASIEVTNVTGPKLAEARILQDDLSDPILAGDLIHSPVWSSGTRLHFALAGFMDVNGDGRSDRKLVRNLIGMSGGVVEAEDGEDGVAPGRMTMHTRYLVLGDRPTETTDAAARSAYTRMIDESRRLGVEQISVYKLLAWMGYRGEIKTVQLGRDARSEDFKARPEDGVLRKSTGNTSGVFRERRPAARTEQGAF